VDAVIDIAQVVAMIAALAAVWYAEQTVIETRALRREERVARLPDLLAEFSYRHDRLPYIDDPGDRAREGVRVEAARERLRAALRASGERLPKCDQVLTPRLQSYGHYIHALDESTALLVRLRGSSKVAEGWRRSIEPALLVYAYFHPGSRTTDMSIVNEGGGIAQAVQFVLVAGGKRAEGVVDDGVVRPGEEVRVHADLLWGDDLQCLVTWRTIDESSWAVDQVGPPIRLRKGRPRWWRWWERRATLDKAWVRLNGGPAPKSLPAVNVQVSVRES
jgi:hypothetical protein